MIPFLSNSLPRSVWSRLSRRRFTYHSCLPSTSVPPSLRRSSHDSQQQHLHSFPTMSKPVKKMSKPHHTRPPAPLPPSSSSARSQPASNPNPRRLNGFPDSDKTTGPTARVNRSIWLATTRCAILNQALLHIYRCLDLFSPPSPVCEGSTVPALPFPSRKLRLATVQSRNAGFTVLGSGRCTRRFLPCTVLLVWVPFGRNCIAVP